MPFNFAQQLSVTPHTGRHFPDKLPGDSAPGKFDWSPKKR
jgi:hypothetical protein